MLQMKFAATETEENTRYQMLCTTQIYVPGCNFFFLFFFKLKIEDFYFHMPYTFQTSLSCFFINWGATLRRNHFQSSHDL